MEEILKKIKLNDFEPLSVVMAWKLQRDVLDIMRDYPDFVLNLPLEQQIELLKIQLEKY